MGKISLLYVVSFCLLLCAAPAMAEINWLKLDEGKSLSASEGKPIIIDFFFGKGCPRCENLDKKVYHNPDIAKKITDDFIPVRVDLTKKLTEQETALGNQYNFRNDCLLLFLDHKGNIIKDSGGKNLCFAREIEPEQFILYLDYIKEEYKEHKF